MTKESCGLPESSNEEVEQEHIGDHDMQAQQNRNDVAAVVSWTVRSVVAVVLRVVSRSACILLWEENWENYSDK